MGHTEVVRELLERGARQDLINHAAGLDTWDMMYAGDAGAQHFNLPILQCLRAYEPPHKARLGGAMRRVVGCAAWLEATWHLTSPLHHFAALPPQRVRSLLADGAHPLATDGSGPAAPTPASLAHALLDSGRPPPWPSARESAQLVADAAGPWSPRTHALFPSMARARAVELLLLGRLLSREERFAGHEEAITDVWESHVLPHAVCRRMPPVAPRGDDEEETSTAAIGSDDEGDSSADDDDGSGGEDNAEDEEDYI